MRKLITAILLSLLVVSPVSANKAQPLDFTHSTGGGQSSQRIEKQTWWIDSVTPDPNHIVVNPGGYGSWDINDHNDSSSTGYLNAGVTQSVTYQHIFDWNPMYSCRVGTCAYWSGVSNWYGTTIVAPSNGLNISVCFAPQNRCFNLVPVWVPDWRAYKYSFCGQAVYGLDDPAIIDIPGSNGGKGIPTNITLSVTNPTSRSVKDITVNWGITSDIVFDSACSNPSPNSDPNIQHSYPFDWRLN